MVTSFTSRASGLYFSFWGLGNTRGSMEDLTKHWRNLSLNDKEGGKLSVKKDRATQEFTLVAKFLTKCVLSTEAIVRTFNPLW